MATTPPAYPDKLQRVEASPVALTLDCDELCVLGVVVVERQAVLLGRASMLSAQVAAEVRLWLFGVGLVVSSGHPLSRFGRWFGSGRHDL